MSSSMNRCGSTETPSDVPQEGQLKLTHGRESYPFLAGIFSMETAVKVVSHFGHLLMDFPLLVTGRLATPVYRSGKSAYSQNQGVI